MSLKTLPSLLALAVLSIACSDDEKSGEEPASEPTSEPSGEDSDQDTDDTDTDTDADDTDTDDTDTGAYVLPVSSISWGFQTGVVDLQPSQYTIPTQEAADGFFYLSLAAVSNNAIVDECRIVWTVSADTAIEDERFATGSLINSSAGLEGEPDTFEAWNGFTLNGTPEALGCDSLGEVTYSTSQGSVPLDWAGELPALLDVQPSFGFGPLTSKLSTALADQQDFDLTKPITGFLSFPWETLGLDDSFLDMNIAFVYEMDTSTLEVSLDPEGSIPQGSEIDAELAPYSDGFYYSMPLYSFQLSPE